MLRLLRSGGRPRARVGILSKSTHNFTAAQEVLTGQCRCGSVGFEALGPSDANFVSHSSLARAASGEPYLTACGFKRDRVHWKNSEQIVNRPPAGSQNAHYFCSECDSYLGVDATRLLGVVALNLAATDVATLPDRYKPNQHTFYADRVEDFGDLLPKWKTVPQGAIVPDHDWAGEELKKEAAPTAARLADGRAIAPSPDWDAVTGRYRQLVRAISPTRAPEPEEYAFPEAADVGKNNVTAASPAQVAARVTAKYHASPGAFVAPARKERDVIIVGGGHNALTSAAYLAEQGLDVLVLERRHVLGGAAVTEELVPGFKFSRGSYLAGLLRPQIIQELELERHGFKYLPRDPSSFTPTPLDGPYGGKSLVLGEDKDANWRSIAQFSKADADAFPLYEEFLGRIREMTQPLLDSAPMDLMSLQGQASFHERMRAARTAQQLVSLGVKHRKTLVPFYELFTAPASFILDRWFESEILKTTLATDAVVGAMMSPTQAGSAYVLLHHVMGEAAGKQGVWSYVEGGMGSISQAIAAAARERGAELLTNATVQRIMHEGEGEGARVCGVRMVDGTELRAPTVLAGCTPYHAFLELMPGLSAASGYAAAEAEEGASPLPADFQHHVRFTDYSCGAFKINCAVDALPNFACWPNDPGMGSAEPGAARSGPQHRGTVHFESRMSEIEDAYREASLGMPASRPVIEMTIPSAVDATLAPLGKHVVQLFVQFAPYDVDPKVGNWADSRFRFAFADRVFSIVDEFCPGFSGSVIERDVLSPLCLEKVFGLQGGNITHGALALHQLGYSRPAPGFSSYRSPLKGLYLCGAGAHPGGGVMGAPGRNAAHVVLSDHGLKPR
jgi:phytoene dehydrogenase-like protein